MMRKENQRSISDWARKTFGPCTIWSVTHRTNDEMQELLELAEAADEDNITDELRTKLAFECADVLVMLYQCADELGVDLHQFLDKKMEINRHRKWQVDGNGHGQHIEE